MNIDFSPAILSLRAGIPAALISFLAATFLAYEFSKSKGGVGRIADTILGLPLILPPCVAGFLLIMIFGTDHPAGIFRGETFDISIAGNWMGCLIAILVIALPSMYHNASRAFSGKNKAAVDAAITIGMRNSAIFWRVVMPSALKPLLSGAVILMIRAVGEYAAVAMLSACVLRG